MMFLDLLDGVEVLAQNGNPRVTGVEYDSRRVQPGHVFVAMRGGSSDGNRFIDRAIAAGGAAGVARFGLQPKEIASGKNPPGGPALCRVLPAFFFPPPFNKPPPRNSPTHTQKNAN